MILRRLQMAGGPAFSSSLVRARDWPLRRITDRQPHSHALLYGSVTLGVLIGVTVSAYWWRQRTRALNLQESPFDRVEELIASCESKIEDIERAIEELKEAAL